MGKWVHIFPKYVCEKVNTTPSARIWNQHAHFIFVLITATPHIQLESENYRRYYFVSLFFIISLQDLGCRVSPHVIITIFNFLIFILFSLFPSHHNFQSFFLFCLFISSWFAEESQISSLVICYSIFEFDVFQAFMFSQQVIQYFFPKHRIFPLLNPFVWFSL